MSGKREKATDNISADIMIKSKRYCERVKMRDIHKGHGWPHKKARKGFRGYPVATIAYYGPDDQLATKVVVGIVARQDEIVAMQKWFSDKDVRYDVSINQQMVEFIDQHHPRSVVVTDGIIGCPHEEGIDYPEGQSCPQCPFWANRDRWTKRIIR